jgi:DGQHR domain-containing protein
MNTNPSSISFPCLKITQPIGEFFIGSIPSQILCDITWFDVRRIESEKRDVETYLGIQRPLHSKRVKEIKNYVETIDACFPTAVIIAVSGVCAKYDEEKKEMTLSSYFGEDKEITYKKIAKVLDGQHRIEGLREYQDQNFEVNISIFVDMDIADQAYIFSTVNLYQTKVNKSLAYDLYDLSRTRSPQRVCHNIAVALDQNEDSPFYKKIKRLGVSTEGRFNETITQATFVQSVLPYLTKDKIKDRDLYLRGKIPDKINNDESLKLIFRNMMIDGQDLEIGDIIWNFFDSVKEKWPDAWSNDGRGIMLNKTNGFKGLMRFLREAYLYITKPGKVPTKTEFSEKIFSKIDLVDDDFTIEKFKPGTSGEAELYRALKSYLTN